MMFIDQGIGIREVGKRLGISWFQAYKKLNAMGISTSWKDDLTPRSRRILKYLVYYKEKYKKTPLLKEIAEGLGLKSCTVLYHLKKLKQLGYVDWEPRKQRSIKIKINNVPRIKTFGLKMDA